MKTASRPHIICHMMSTIDGKIDSGIKGKNILDDYYIVYSGLEKKLKPNAWMVGRVTAEMFAEAVGTTLPLSNKEIDPSDFRSSAKTGNFLIAVDTNGVLRWEKNILTFGNQSLHEIIIAVTTKTPPAYLSYLQEKDISYIVAGVDEINFMELFRKLKSDFHVDRLLLEGGALLNGSVMAKDLIDEISLLVTPLVLNRSNSPSVFERNVEEELNVKKYKLAEMKQMDNDSIWLRYVKK